MVCRLFVILALLCLAGPPARGNEPMTVFAASSLTDAMEAAAAAWRDAGGSPIRFSFASSSTLARQIEAGAPATIYASANALWMDYLEERDFIVAETRSSPIGNALVLVAPVDRGPSVVTVDRDLDLTGLLGAHGRLAVGDPAHVPAGLYAREALSRLGLWRAVEPRLARADNVRAALALVARGEAPLGIVYATDLALSADVVRVGTFPAESHTPITYPFALVAGARGPEAEALLAFLTTEPGLAVFERFGFEATDPVPPASGG